MHGPKLFSSKVIVLQIHTERLLYLDFLESKKMHVRRISTCTVTKHTWLYLRKWLTILLQWLQNARDVYVVSKEITSHNLFLQLVGNGV